MKNTSKIIIFLVIISVLVLSGCNDNEVVQEKDDIVNNQQELLEEEIGKVNLKNEYGSEYSLKYNNTKYSAVLIDEGEVLEPNENGTLIIDNQVLSFVDKGQELEGLNTDAFLVIKYVEVANTKTGLGATYEEVEKTIYGEIINFEEIELGNRDGRKYLALDPATDFLDSPIDLNITYYVFPASEVAFYQLAVYRDIEKAEELINTIEFRVLQY